MRILSKVFYILVVIFSTNISAKTTINIGTGSKKALAFPTLSNICNIYDKYGNYDVNCNVISTGGAKDNLEQILKGKIEMAVTKANVQRYRYENPKRKKENNLRTLFGLHYEYFTILVKSDQIAHGFLDLKNKRVNIPNQGSGSRILYDDIMQRYGLDNSFFKEVYEENIAELKNLFCNDKIDAAIFYVGHPNKAYIDTVEQCDVKFVSFSKDEINKYLDMSEYYTLLINKAKIPQNTYKNQTEEINTFGSQLILSASVSLDEEIIYDFTKVFFTHFDEIVKLSPALKGASPVQIFNIGGIAPLHQGVIKYYHERALLALPY